MCRLLYVKSKDLFEPEEFLGKFAEISKNSKEYQGHGWGCAYRENGIWKFYKNINPVWEDNFKQFGSCDILIAHARSAFQDKDIIVENNMPFYDDKYIFVFNGELRGVKIKEDGRIGAEKIFNFIKRFDSDGMLKALGRGVEVIKKRTGYIKAMNIIIAENDKAYLSTFHSEEKEYFTMHYKREKDTIVLCSEKFPFEDGWEKIQNNYLGEF